MNYSKENLIEKIRFLEDELREFKDYHYVEETYGYLRSELDRHLVLLKKKEVEERMLQIDGDYPGSDSLVVAQT